MAPRIQARLVPPPSPDDTHDWREQAQCRGVDPNLFHPDTSATPHEALRICRACTVRSECLAAGRHEDEGVWGGTTAKQRKALKRKKAS